MLKSVLKVKCFKDVVKYVIRALQKLEYLLIKPDASECFLIADPNPIPIQIMSIVGHTKIRWSSAALKVELRVDAPDGPLFAIGGRRGEVLTGNWVSDGMTFYLQDVSKKTQETTLAKLTIYLKYKIEIAWLPNHEEIISNIVLKKTGKRPLVVQPQSTFTGLVSKVRLVDRTVYFKAAPETGPIALEAWALQKAGEVGVPVPTVLEFNQIGEHFTGSYLLLEEVSGIPSSIPDLPDTVLWIALREAGKCLRMIHSIPVIGYGELQLKDGMPFGKHQSWGEFLYDIYKDYFYIKVNELVDYTILDWVLMQMDQIDNIQPLPEAILLHGDLFGSNILVNVEQGCLAGIIDFSSAIGGDPFFDLSLFLYANGLKKFNYILEGYSLGPGQLKYFERILPFYIMIHSIQFLRYGDEQGFEDVKLHARRALSNLKDVGLSVI